MIVLTVTAIFAFMPQIHAQEPEELDVPYVDFEIPFSKIVSYDEVSVTPYGFSFFAHDYFTFFILGHDNERGDPQDPYQVSTSDFLPQLVSVRLFTEHSTKMELYKSQFPAIRYTVPGRYYYDVHEGISDTPYCEYDDSEFVVCVEVKNNDDGGLTASVATVYGNRLFTEKIPSISFYNSILGPGSLTISKTVTGELGDHNKDFKFSVQFENLDYDFNAGEHGSITDGVGYITLKHGESVTLTGLPPLTKYSINEILEAGDPYTTTVKTNGIIKDDTFASGEIQAATETIIAYTNNPPYTLVVGLNMDMLPFVLIGIISLGGFAFIIYKKRIRASVR